MESKKSKIKRKIIKLLPSNLKKFIEQEFINNHLYYKYLNQSFSQEGEDLILQQFFYGEENGFFIDIGAHHPIKYSNTYKFYLKGWRGINIDAMPGSMKEFVKIRPQDTNLEVAISDNNQVLGYNIYEETAVNTFSEELYKSRKSGGLDIINRIEMKTITLRQVLEKHLPFSNVIDFMSIDVEGFELEVLKSNNWKKFRPKIILVESLQNENKQQLDNFLSQVNYEIIAFTPNNLFYKDNSHTLELNQNLNLS